ncbi:MAG TPA: hypothetical protein VGR08_01905, partial [Thermomicrobiales bacterium]|nr:hypothetical protein [Thermomicrobiales bacterium]
GLEDVVLEQDPNEAGLPVDVKPESFGLYAAAFLDDDGPAVAVGSADGLYAAARPSGRWSHVDGTAQRIRQLSVIPGSDRLLYATEDQVFEIPVPAGLASNPDAPNGIISRTSASLIS